MGSLLRETVPEQAMEEEQPSFEMDQVVAVEELVDMYADENPSSGPVYPVRLAYFQNVYTDAVI